MAGFPATVVTGESKAAKSGSEDKTGFVPPRYFSNALKTAAADGKPIVLDFMATWCAPCKQLANETFVHPDVVSLLEQCVLLKIDTDEFPELAKSFDVTSLPDIRFLRPDGTQIEQLSGFQDVETMAAELRELLRQVND
jgi:thiol:disulfide interchange protein DsbD